MADLEKVIKSIEHCVARYIDGLCDDCPYMGALDKSYMIPMKCKEIIMRDALELLKEQDKLLRKQQKGIDKLCCDIAYLKHRFYEKTEIVRCKDCKKRNTIHCPVRNTVTNIDKSFADNWFCKDGERK